MEMYNNVGLPKVPSLFESDRSDKPTWLRKIPAFKGGRRKKLLTFRRNQLRTLWSLDRTIGSLLDQLHISDLIDQTLIFYISDNGVFLGEHGLGSKAAVYEEAVKVPVGVYLKGVFEGGGVNREHLVANIDIAPTIYDLVGIAPKVKPDGLSLRPLSQGRTSWSKGLLLESWRGSESRTPFVAYHTADSVYVKNSGERSEFYDLIVDPHQLDNRIDDPKLASKLSSLEKDLNATLMRVRGSVSFDVPQAARGKTKFERKKLRAKAAQVAESP